MYNTDFKVKYHGIEEELNWKLKNKTVKELDKKTEPEYEYSEQDVLDICDKLYRDELTNVFYAEDILDDKIDAGMNYVSQKMLENSEFKLIVKKLKIQLYLNKLNSEKELTSELTSETTNETTSETTAEYLSENYENMIIIYLFNKASFYLFHKCICQQLTLGSIDKTLLDELNKIVTLS